MAKSIRSKWKRKCRAIKRERYGKKELDRLKKTLGIDESQNVSNDVQMAEVSKVANVVTAATIAKAVVNENEMETDTTKKVFNVKTLRDQNGCYPVWLHPRKVKKNKSKKKVTKKVTKKGKKGRRS